MRNTILKPNLLENAKDSLVEGLSKYHEGRDRDSKSLKFAILHISRFVELSFKYFLTEVHELLIYKKPFDKTLNRNMTITMDEAINFFKHSHELDVSNDSEIKSDKFLSDMGFIKNLRNQIEHCEYNESDVQKVKMALGRILSFMNFQYEKHEITITEEFGFTENQKSLFAKLIDEYEHKLLMAGDEADEIITSSDYSLMDFCPDCSEYTYVYDSGIGKFRCTFCGESDTTVESRICGEPVAQNLAVTPFEDAEVYFCSEQCMVTDMNSKGCGPDQ